MKYWDAILDEIEHKNEREMVQFKFTDMGRTLLDQHNRLQRAIRKRLPEHKHQHPAYYLGDKYEDVYFTQREAEALYYLYKLDSQGRVAKKMGLSKRTVEFYVKNMKLKMGLRSMKELLEKAKETDVLEAFEAACKLDKEDE